MEDRYLFHAKRIDNGERVEGFLVKKHGLFFIYSIINSDTCRQHNYEVDQSTICQCTGRYDEWEHDIFQCDEDRYKIQFCEDSLTWEAVSVFSSESIELGEFSPSEYVRLGNAIDNPELLEVKE